MCEVAAKIDLTESSGKAHSELCQIRQTWLIFLPFKVVSPSDMDERDESWSVEYL